MKDQLNKYKLLLINNLFEFVYTVIPALIVCIPLIFFNNYIQTGYPPILENPYNLQNWEIIEPFYRIFTHSSEEHFNGNILSVLIYSLLIGVFFKLRFVLLSYLLLIVQSALTIKYLVNGIGISIFSYGLFGTISVTFLIILINNIIFFMNNYGEDNDTSLRKVGISVILLYIFWILMNTQIFIEILYLFEFSIIEDILNIRYITEIRAATKYSSMSHISGYLSGLIIGLLAYTINKYTKYNPYRSNI